LINMNPIRCLTLLAILTTSATAGELVDRSQELETLRTDLGLADGPSWDGMSGLYVPDVKGGRLYRYVPARDAWQTVLDDAGRISATYFNQGRLFLSDNGNSGIATLDGREKAAIVANDPDAQPPLRPNDLVVDTDGGIYYTLTQSDRVMYVTPGGKQQVAVDDVKTPNGIILSPDGATLYVAAYRPKEVWAYNVTAPGHVSGGRLLAAMDDGDEPGADGMTIDRAGNVYCAGATDVWIWSPAGELLEKIACPTRPINCVFGDADQQSLYITGFGGLYRQRMNISGRPPHPPMTAELQPANSNRPPTTLPEGVTPNLDVVYAQYGTRKLLADVFVPDGDGPLPAVVVVHGGGWLKGDKTKFRALALQLAARGFVTAAIEYRLGGEARFPAAIHDCNAAVRFLRANARRFHVDPDRIGAVGGSAGGHLVGLMATGSDDPALQGDGGYPDRSSRLQAAIVMAGPMQIATGSVAERSLSDPEASNSVRWIGGNVNENPDGYHLADAYEHITADDPPLLFMSGELDHPERNQPSRDRLTEVGVETGLNVYPDGKHGCWNQLPWFDTMVDDMESFFSEHLRARQ
jgi:gluconolactonase